MATPTLRKPHDPAKLKRKGATEFKRRVLEGIEAGLPLTRAFEYGGVSKNTYKKWRKWWIEDIEDGFTGTNLIMFMNEVMMADTALQKRISEVMIEKAITEKDTRLLMYLGDNRLGYANERKNQVELGSSGTNNVQINIIDMKSIDDNRSDDDFIEVNNYEERGDDSDSAEMD